MVDPIQASDKLAVLLTGSATLEDVLLAGHIIQTCLDHHVNIDDNALQRIFAAHSVKADLINEFFKYEEKWEDRHATKVLLDRFKGLVPRSWAERHFIQNYIPDALKRRPERGDFLNVSGLTTRTMLRVCSTLIDAQLYTRYKKLNTRVLRDGINALPDEIISAIAEYALADCDTLNGERDWQLVTLRSVSRRFQHVVVNCPTLWLHVSSADSIEWVNLKLSRSARCQLKIDGSVCRERASVNGDIPCACLSFVERIVSQRERIGSIDRLTGVLHQFDEDEPNYRCANAHKRRILKKLCLPELRCLTTYDLNEPVLYRSWNIPKLESLSCNQDFPLEPLKPLCDKLRSVEVVFDPKDWHLGDKKIARSIERLVKLLKARAVARVERLELRLYNLFEGNPRILAGVYLSPMVFNNVKVYRTWLTWTGARWQIKILRRVEIHYVERLEFHINVQSARGELPEHLRSRARTFKDLCSPHHYQLFAWLADRTWPSLETIHFTLSMYCSKDPIFKDLQAIQEFLYVTIVEGWRRQITNRSWVRNAGLSTFPTIQITGVPSH